MNQNYIEDMVRQLIEDGVIKAEQANDATSSLDTCWRDKAVSVWTVPDVIDYAKKNGWTLNDKQAMEILYETHIRFDAAVGINWEVIGTHIYHYCQIHNVSKV